MRALAAYGRLHPDGRARSLSQEEAAKVVGVGTGTWPKLVGRKGDLITRATEEQQAKLAAYVGMPTAFFEVDFDRLYELASERLPITPDLLRAARAIVELADGAEEFSEAAEQAARPPDQQRGQRGRAQPGEDDQPADG